MLFRPLWESVALEHLFIELHQLTGTTPFVLITIAIGLLLSLWIIPWTTDLMVNASAGLAGRYLGRKHRTLIINCSTNNPEAGSMLVAMAMGRLGGIANPLGSNLANIYLIFIVAPLWVIARFLVTGRRQQAGAMLKLFASQKKLVAWHLGLACLMWALAFTGYQLMLRLKPEPEAGGGGTIEVMWILPAVFGLGLAGVLGFVVLDRWLQRRKPGLYEDIDDDEHTESWLRFAAGTVGLVLACYVLNSLFLACSELFADRLSRWVGAAVFAGLHYFLGALVTSLPELTVATKNYARLTPPDLNTAMASASVSNMTNLAIATLGAGIAAIMLIFGAQFVL